jgi:uncharacterized low-complexity protein
MDALRAMREARYAEMTARSTASAAPRRTPAPGAPARTKAATKPGSTKAGATKPATADAVEGRCGHRNMSGRTCTREQGHAAKTHRYS